MNNTPRMLCKQEFKKKFDEAVCPSHVMGIDCLRDPYLHKGLAFTLEERQILGIHGMQPPRIRTQEEQITLCKISLDRYTDPLDKYIYLIDLQERNLRLFFRFVSENIDEILPIIYTPTVGLACQRFGLIYRRPHGLFITINDLNHVFDIIKNWPECNVRAIVVTDGERILGLGDLGACGMGISVGKLSLYTALAGIKPQQCLPVLIDVGTNSDDLLEDPLYIGLRQKRVRGEAYDQLIDEFMRAVVSRYGQNTLIQFEDFGKENAFRLLNKYRNIYCTFNDDIQGTAAVAVAGLYASKRITGKNLSDNTFLFVGAGSASLGIADLLVKAIMEDGVSKKDACNMIWLTDINGLVTKQTKDMSAQLEVYAKEHEPITSLDEIVAKLNPSVLIGASATGRLFTPKILRTMADNHKRPIVFALSNPTSKAECTAEEAYTNTDGRVIFSSGSPFPTTEFNGKTYYAGQGNNAYIFPGVALGVIASGTHHVPDDMFLVAAKELANFVGQSHLERGSLYPLLSDIKEISLCIAVAVVKCAYNKGLASTYPEPSDKRKWLKNQLYNTCYESALPTTWEWPNVSHSEIKDKKVENHVETKDHNGEKENKD